MYVLVLFFELVLTVTE